MSRHRTEIGAEANPLPERSAGPGEGPVLVVRDPRAPPADHESGAVRLGRLIAPAFEGLHTIEVDATPRPSSAILRRADAVGAALVVVPAGRFRWNGDPSALEGPEQYVARHAERPVLLVPDGVSWAEPPVFGAATDFSWPAHRAVEWTARLAERVGGRLCVLHAASSSGATLPASSPPGGLPPEGPGPGTASERLASECRDLEEETGLDVRARYVRAAVPAEALATCAAGDGCFLLGVGTVGVGGGGDRLMGRTAEGVLRRFGGAVAVVGGGVEGRANRALDRGRGGAAAR